MFLYSIFLFLSIPLFTSASLINYAEEEIKSPSRCGEVLTSTYGIISYKPNETYIPNERCVWIIRVENATSFDFNFLEMGYPRTDYNAKIVAFDFYTTYRYYPSLGVRNIPGNVAVVTFTTSSDPNPVHQGFTMTYLAITQNETVVSSASKDYITSFGEGQISHPQNGDLYTNNEINLLIITPEFSQVPGRKIELNFTKFELEGNNCTDRIYVTQFTTDLDPAGGWAGGDLAQVLCNDRGVLEIESSDMIMFVFITQSGTRAAGIEATFNSYIPNIGNESKQNNVT